MSAGDIVLVVLAAVLFVVAGLLACLDAALSRVSRVVVEEAQRDGRRGAAKLAVLVTDPARYLSLLLLVRKTAELCATALLALVAIRLYGEDLRAVGAATLVATIADYIIVGVAARTYGRQHARRIAVLGAGFAVTLARVLGPLSRLLIGIGNALTPGRGYRDGPFASEAELRDLVDLAEEGNVIERSERDMIASVFELGDTLAREVMVPRPDVVFIERTKTVRQALALALRSGFSRVPVVGENADDVVGVAFLKDLVRREQQGWDDRPVEAAMREAVFVPDSKPADELLREMQARRVHLVIVVDEYGGTAGLVTIEDVLEEIVGEITDEYDRELPPVQRLPDGAVRVTARLPVEDLAELFDVELPAGDVETVGGLLASVLGRVPITGSTVSIAGLTLRAESLAGRRNRIGTVLVERTGSDDGEPDGPGAAGGRPADEAGGDRDRHSLHRLPRDEAGADEPAGDAEPQPAAR